MLQIEVRGISLELNLDKHGCDELIICIGFFLSVST